MNDHVPDIDRCKRLREMGFSQYEPLFLYVKRANSGRWTIELRRALNDCALVDWVAAPIVTELIAEIQKAVPSTSRTWMEISVMEDGVFVNLIGHEDAETYADTLPNALADLWLKEVER
jgi:hypothetical protein